jgi:Uma2 family endonuclease
MCIIGFIPLLSLSELTAEQKEKFPPICPDFVIELLSPTDSLKVTQEKMKEYIDNGVQLGLLINRKLRQVMMYRQGREVEILESPTTVSGEEVLNGFVLNLEPIW